MTMGSNTRLRRRLWWCVAAAALAIGVVAFLGTLPKSDPAMLVLSHATSTPKLVPSTKTLSITRSRPVTLTIPVLGIHTVVGTLGLQPDHQVMVPTSTHVVGWYDDGPTPGQVGSAVILGHVDSYLGPGTFFYLKNMKAGNSIVVTLTDGATAHFVVTNVVQYAKAAFPDQLVYGSHGVSSLQLVTCGGTFDHATGHYESNIVVFSRLVSATPPTH
jgi:sortase (surface protein transpeptidase)